MIPAENQQIVHLTSSTIITRKELPEWPKTLPMTTFRPSNHHLAFHLQIPSRIGPVVGNRNQRNPTAEGSFGSAFSVQTAFKTKVNKMNRIEKLIAGWYRVDDDWCSSFSNHNRTWWHYLFVSDKTISHRRKIRCREAGFPATHDSVVSGSKRLLTTTQTCSKRKNSLDSRKCLSWLWRLAHAYRVFISTWKQMNREISVLRGHRLSNMHNDLAFLISVTGTNRWWADDHAAIAGSHRLADSTDIPRQIVSPDLQIWQ